MTDIYRGDDPCATAIMFRLPGHTHWQLLCEEGDLVNVRERGGECFATFKDKTLGDESFECNAAGNYYRARGKRVSHDEAEAYLHRGTIFLGPANAQEALTPA
jgi:hypothetical protein